MTTKYNTIEIEYVNYSLVIYHLNRLLIVCLSTIALVLDGYQISDIYYGISIIIWLWLPQIEILERNITRNIIKQFSIVLFSSSMVIAIYMGLGAFNHIIQWLPVTLPVYMIWILVSILLMAFLSFFFKTIILLAINNPVKNIGKEFAGRR